MSDRELAIKLAADASELNKATAQGAAGLTALGKAGGQAGRDAQAGAAGVTSAAKAEADAIDKARRSSADALRVQQMAMRESRAEANLLKQANRQLAMQMTDVVTSVASGMPIWMVAIQQGGQVKDAYGGIVPAARAVLGMLTPLNVALGVGAVAAGAMVLAYNQGAGELQAFGRALALTGNAAGTTIGQLEATARAMDAAGTTQGKAAEVLALAAGSGRVAAQNLQLVAMAAIDLERAAGVSVADTVAQFAELGRSPVQASERLNAQVHHLTTGVYDQIKALEKQGRTADAGALAQQAYAEAVQRQAKDIELQLGALERAWFKLGRGAKEAWDFMLNIGRPETAEQELDRLTKELAQPRQRSDKQMWGNDARANKEARKAELQAQIYMQGEAAAADAAAAESVEQHIKASADRDKRAKAAADEAAREQKARRDAEMAALRSAGQGMAAIYADEQRLLDAQHSAGLVSDAAYYATKRQLIEQAAIDQRGALAAENARLQADKLSGAEKIKRDADVAQNVAEAARIEAKAKADITLTNLAEANSLTLLSRAQAEYVRGLQAAAQARADADSRDLGGRRLGDGARGAAARQGAIADQFNDAEAQLRRDLDAKNITGAQFTDRQAALRAYYNQALQQEQEYQDARARIEADASVGFDRALANYGESSRNQARQTEELWSNAFSDMEDALVRFTVTGKGSFTDLANSIVSDLMRIYIRQQLVGMVGAGLDFLQFQGPVVGATGDFARMDRLAGAVQHGGGVMGIDGPTAMRSMPASTWANAPRLHTGRLASDEYAAILQKDESVLTPGQMRQLAPAGGGSGAQVNLELQVINQTGTPVAATARRTQGGGIELLLTSAEEQIAGNVAAGQGPIYTALKGRFNLRDY